MVCLAQVCWQDTLQGRALTSEAGLALIQLSLLGSWCPEEQQRGAVRAGGRAPGARIRTLHVFERCSGRDSRKGALCLQDVLLRALGQMCRAGTESCGGSESLMGTCCPWPGQRRAALTARG